MPKKKKKLGIKITQIACTADSLFALTENGEIYVYLEDEDDGDSWEQLSSLSEDTIIAVGDFEDDED